MRRFRLARPPSSRARDSPLQRSGLLERPRWGSSASSLRAPAPPGPAAPQSGRPRATAARRPGPRPLPRPRACGRAAVGGGAGLGRASEAPPRQLGLRAREAGSAARTCPGPRRPPRATPGAARGRAARRALCPGRQPCGAKRRRRGGSWPAPWTRRAAFSAARSAPLSQSRAWPAAWNRVAELCARFGVRVDGGRAWPASPRAPSRLVPGALREIFKAPQY